MDPNELEMFQNLAEDWYKYGEPLCAMNGLRVPCIVERLEFLGVLKKEYIGTEQPLRGLTILDVGCGGGFVSEPLAKLGAEVTGIDGVPELIEVAKKHAALDNTLTKLTYLAESIQDFAKKSIEQYDVVLALEVIDHVCDKQGFTEASIKCLKPGGSIFLSSPNRTFWSWFFYIIVPEYILCLLPRGTHNYDNFISMDDMEKMLESCNCTLKFAKGMFYNIFRKSWFWINSTAAVYFIHAVKN